jgi:hypothetical protein
MLGNGKRIDGCAALHLYLFAADTGDAALDAALKGDLQLRQMITGTPDDPASFARDRFLVAYDRLAELDADAAADAGVRALFGLLAGFEVKIGRVTYAARTFGSSLASRLYVLAARTRRRPNFAAAAFTEFADVARHVLALARNAERAAERVAEQRAAEKRAKAGFLNPLAVGDVLFASTAGVLFRFYRVVKVTPLGAVVRRVATDESSVIVFRPGDEYAAGSREVRLRFRFRGGQTFGMVVRDHGRDRVYLYDGPIPRRSL